MAKGEHGAPGVKVSWWKFWRPAWHHAAIASGLIVVGVAAPFAAVCKVGFTIAGFLLFGMQIIAACKLLRSTVLEGERAGVATSALDAPEPINPSDEYLTNLLADGFERFRDTDITLTAGMLLQPSVYTYRINEEYEPEDPMALQVITRHISAPVSGKVLLPVAKIRKGVLLDGLEVEINQRRVVTVSYDHYLHLAAYMLIFLRLADLPENSVPERESAKNSGWLLELFMAHPELLKGLREDLAKIAAPAKSVSALRGQDLPSAADHGATKTQALVELLTGSYAVLAEIDVGEKGGPLVVQMKRILSTPSALKLKESRKTKRNNEKRFRLNVSPASFDIGTALMYEAQSYHLALHLPQGMYVADHRIAASTDGKLKDLNLEDFVDGTVFAAAASPMESAPYIRRRSLRAEPYTHFYARNGHKLKQIDHKHIVDVEESPFATLRLAATLGVLCFVGLIIAGISVTNGIASPAAGLGDGYDIRSTAIALAVSVPGILASWSRQAFGVEALRRACLTTQYALRVTTLLSGVGLALAVLQDAGFLRWPVHVEFEVLTLPASIPIHDWYWLVLVAASCVVGLIVYCKYLWRRAVYLQRRRKSINIKASL